MDSNQREVEIWFTSWTLTHPRKIDIWKMKFPLNGDMLLLGAIYCSSTCILQTFFPVVFCRSSSDVRIQNPHYPSFSKEHFSCILKFYLKLNEPNYIVCRIPNSSDTWLSFSLFISGSPKVQRHCTGPLARAPVTVPQAGSRWALICFIGAIQRWKVL